MIETPSSNYPTHNTTLAFDVDGMLGGLAKWLRILGFDAAYPITSPSSGRIFITTQKNISFLSTVQVALGEPEEQLVQVLNELGIKPDPGLFFSRCLVCNIEVNSMSKEEAAQKVPEQIFQTFSEFNQCPTCGRIYWEGSHAERIKERLKQVGILSLP